MSRWQRETRYSLHQRSRVLFVERWHWLEMKGGREQNEMRNRACGETATCDSHHDTGHSASNCSMASNVAESLEEMDFQRSLAAAAQVGDLQRMQKLLDKGANVDGDDNDSGYAPLHYAARQGHVQACQLLLQHGASVDQRTRAGKATGLHRAAYAGKLEVVKLLLQHGADPMAQDSDGYTPLHKAGMQAHEEIVKLLTINSDQAGEVK